ncbi:EndoU domain-containing protein [Sandaracinobacteroides saxicola]|uniref:EndoU domain-containing protein n=1 Tax=Sandaracinobacteroides saxicola TaxID=2759707 RepID=A0A7G5IHL9_9SPHN|nr:EndoU domain-containing protein [Sandaracinobacteroides saxicola]QMW22861.1 EndoU domain-containing protein [Sandaracinobacteroides saxicola]
MAKNPPSAATIALRIGAGCHFGAGMMAHMMHGGQVAGNGPHSGLHSLNLAAGMYPGLHEVARIDTDARVPGIYCADVALTGAKAAKRSSFFPAIMTWVQIQAAITAAWEDSHVYAPQSEVYGQIAAKYGLSWAGLATIGGHRIWVGGTRAGTMANPLDTAFPAVNNKFL